MQRPEASDGPHVKAVMDIRQRVYDLRSHAEATARDMKGTAEELAPIIGSLTCCMTALYDSVERLRRWQKQHS